MQTTNYAENISTAKKVARDYLRTKAMLPLSSQVNELKTQVRQENENFEGQKKNIEHTIAVKNFEAQNLPEAHPNKTKVMEEAAKYEEAANQTLQKSKELSDRYIESLEERIKALQDRLAKWESGETKVSKEELERVALELLSDATKKAYYEMTNETPAQA
jgi:hypothetical protein